MAKRYYKQRNKRKLWNHKNKGIQYNETFPKTIENLNLVKNYIGKSELHENKIMQTTDKSIEIIINNNSIIFLSNNKLELERIKDLFNPHIYNLGTEPLITKPLTLTK